MFDRAINEADDRSPRFRYDRYVVIGLSIYGLLMLIRFALLSDEWQIRFDYDYAEVFLVATVLVLLIRRTRQASDTSHRIFSGLLLTGFSAWFCVSLFRAIDPEWSTSDVQLFRDLLFMLHYAIIAVAIELQLDSYRDGQWLPRRSPHAIGGFLLVYATFSYFAIVPIFVASPTYATPYGLYAAIDCFLAVRLFSSAFRTSDPAWRGVYTRFGLVFFLIFASDLLSIAYSYTYLQFVPSSLLNLVWYLWYPFAFVAIGLKTIQRAAAPSDDATFLGPATTGLLIFGLALPFAHVFGYGFALFDPDIRGIRDIFVAAWIVLITGILYGVYKFIGRRMAKLDAERTNAEKMTVKLEHQLEREQKLRLLGRLSAGLAHDFGNSLFAISSHAKAIEKEYENSNSAAPQGIKGINQAIQYARQLVAKLSLVGSSASTPYVESFDINEEIEKTIELIAPSLAKEVVLNYQSGQDKIIVKAEQSMVQQVLTNYIFNAADAVGPRGQVDVSMDVYPVRSQCASCGDDVTGKFAVLTVTDDGPGVDLSVKDNIFEPLITTKAIGKGSGLGLAMIHAIMHRIGGHVGLKSSPQKGTSFTAYFPL